MPQILVIAGDKWHSSEITKRGLTALSDLLKHTITFDIVTSPKDSLTPEFIQRYPAIICCKSNNVSTGEPWFDTNIAELNPVDFYNYVNNGGFFIALHAGASYYNDVTRIERCWKKPNEDYINLIGARFLGHPPRCAVTIHPISGHPIMHDVKDFTERDEQYQLDIFAKDAQILFTTSSALEKDSWPGGYFREIGKGAVVVLTPGHTLSVWTNPEYQKILSNTLYWCLNRQEVNSYF